MQSVLRSKVFQYILIVILGFIIYGNTAKHDFALDDKRLILGNELVKKGAFAELAAHGTFYGFNGDNSGAYRPLSMIYYSVIYKTGNGKPYLFHLFNILLFIASSIILLELFKLVFPEQQLWLALAGTLLFVVHPIHTEVVANVKSADELLYLVFSLLSLLFWIRYLKDQRKQKLVLSCSFFALALLSKETALACIPVFGVLLLIFAGNKAAAVRPFLAYFLLAGLYLFLRSAILTDSLVQTFMAVNNSLYVIQDPSHLLATKLYLLGLYVFKMLWAIPLSWDYSFGAIQEHSFADAGVWAAFLLVALSLFVCIKYFRKEPVLVLGITWFWALLLPASNTFIMIESTFAERFLYGPGIGIILILAWTFTKLPVSARKIYWAGFAVVFLVFASQTIARNAQWKNDRTIVAADIHHSNAIRIQMSYISDLFQKADQSSDPVIRKKSLDSALVFAKKAQQLLPDYSEANYLLARSYLYLQQNKEAEEYYLRTIQLEPGNVRSLNDLGVIYAGNNEYEKSLDYFIRAAAADSSDSKSAENAAAIAYHLEKNELARTYFQKALKLNPSSPAALRNLPKIDSILRFKGKAD
jgi:protein O-mannosyl-transferase